MNRPIAIFDSGVGGFTVVKDIMNLLPAQPIVYVGDTARAPYGNRTAEEILQYADEICAYLMQYEPKLIVIACNTATAHAINLLRNKYTIPIIGVIEPGVKAALNAYKGGVIGVIGTAATINSKAYENTIKRVNPQIDVVSYACPSFVPLVEQGKYNTSEAYKVVEQALEPLNKTQLDCLILGCTHYPFLRHVIQKTLGDDVQLIHSGYETAKQVRKILLDQYVTDKKEYRASITHESHVFICSGSLSLFREIGRRWLSNDLYGRSCEWKMMHSMTIS